MPRMIRNIAMMLLILVILMAAAPAQIRTGDRDNSSERLVLNVYMDKTGKALVTGYVSDPAGLPFLNASQYRYENDTLQLYALTDALTRKEGDLWNMQFFSRGYYDAYHITFYLPGDLLLKRINSTPGLEYLLSASNQSLVADVQGYEVQDPAVIIEYQQPLQEAAGSSGSSSQNQLLVEAILLALGSALAVYIWRRKVASRSDSSRAETVASAQAAAPLQTETVSSEPAEIEPEEEGDHLEADRPEGVASFVDAEEAALPSEVPSEMAGAIDSAAKKEIEITSEMAAVMETLTPRERAILQALIDAGGRMTQADLRYETRTPKSSLSGILLSLERRKLITKKEWGRTNVIELSEWFLSKKNGS